MAKKEGGITIDDVDPEPEEAKDPYANGEKVDKFAILEQYDFPVTITGEDIVEYDDK